MMNLPVIASSSLVISAEIINSSSSGRVFAAAGDLTEAVSAAELVAAAVHPRHTSTLSPVDFMGSALTNDVGAVGMNFSKYDSKLTPEEDIGIGIFMTFIGCMAVLLNGRLLISFWKDRKTLQPPEFFFVNLCLSDMITIIFAYPLSNISFYSHRWRWGEAGCIFYGSTSYFSAIAGIYSLMAVAIMRYVKTCRAEYGIRLTSAAAKKSISLIYAVSLLWTALPFMGWGRYDVEPYGLSCTLDWWSNDIGDMVQMVLACIFVCFIPAAIMVYCYGCIIATVRDANRRMANHGITKSKGPSETRLTVISAVLCFGMMVAWFPYTIVSLATAIGGKNSLPMRLTVVPVLMAKCSHGYNPLIYFMMASDKRMKANGIINCCVNRKSRNSISTESNFQDGVTQIGENQNSSVSPRRIPLSVLGAFVSETAHNGPSTVPKSRHASSSGKTSIASSSLGQQQVVISMGGDFEFEETLPRRNKSSTKRVRSADASPIKKKRCQHTLSTPALTSTSHQDTKLNRFRRFESPSSFFKSRVKSDSLLLVGKCVSSTVSTAGAVINEKSISEQALLGRKASFPFAKAATVDAAGITGLDESGKLVYIVGPGEFWL